MLFVISPKDIKTRSTEPTVSDDGDAEEEDKAAGVMKKYVTKLGNAYEKWHHDKTAITESGLSEGTYFKQNSKEAACQSYHTFRKYTAFFAKALNPEKPLIPMQVLRNLYWERPVISAIKSAVVFFLERITTSIATAKFRHAVTRLCRW
eukprot:gb/GEZN01016496.1/.p1 GENE.gb/GEZN01016496.1/~~gb/GEZN01016496.1/.p1  ORF type:complete len:149 (+),score=19.56 gb/GEZN01016496.1/:188-634(+)